MKYSFGKRAVSSLWTPLAKHCIKWYFEGEDAEENIVILKKQRQDISLFHRFTVQEGCEVDTI